MLLTKVIILNVYLKKTSKISPHVASIEVVARVLNLNSTC